MNLDLRLFTESASKQLILLYVGFEAWLLAALFCQPGTWGDGVFGFQHQCLMCVCVNMDSNTSVSDVCV